MTATAALSPLARCLTVAGLFGLWNSTATAQTHEAKVNKVAICKFCTPEIVQKQAVFETKNFFVFADYAPITPGHLLILPKKHVRVLDDVDSNIGNEFFRLCKKVKEAFVAHEHTDQYIMLEKMAKMPDSQLTICIFT